MRNVFDIFFKSTKTVQNQAEIDYIRNRVMCKFPLLGPTMEKLKHNATNAVERAATDGSVVYYNPDWFMGLTDEEKMFVYAHEVMHVKFNHIPRCMGRDLDLWNIATDAVINQMLKSENMTMPNVGVDIADAIQHSAEEMYDKLLERKKQKQQKQQQGDQNQKQQQNGDSQGQQSQQRGQGQQNGVKSLDDYDLDDILNQAPKNHDMWHDAACRAQREKERKNSKKQNEAQNSDENTNQSELEKSFCEQNKRLRDELAAQARRQILAATQDAGNGIGNLDRTMGEICKTDAAVNWKKVLTKSVEKENDKWSYRRSDADNDFMARVEEMEDEDQSETEVILDVSGSVSDSFLREFLRQLKPLLKNSKLKVGFFDTRFYPFVEIKKDKDIDRLHIPGGGGTNMDVAVRNFSKKADVNKIVFTDGCGVTTDHSLEKTKNLIWLVYGNSAFKPLCGRVIPVDPNTIRHNFVCAPYMFPNQKSR